MVHPYVQLFSKSLFVLRPRIINALGEEFLPLYLPAGVTVQEVFDKKVFPFTTSNISRYVDISMAHEIDAGRGTEHGAVLFSYAHVAAPRLRAGVPNTFRWLAQRGLDMQADDLEVGIAFQCMNGGVRMTNPDAESTIPGLFVIGELAGGVRGPDRPGGNSLAEGQVFGHRAGVAAAARAKRSKAGTSASLDVSLAFLAGALSTNGGVDFRGIAATVRQRMQTHCLVEKSGAALSETLEAVRTAKRELESGLALDSESLVEGLGVRNLVQASELVLCACLNRRETRGSHYRLDFPEADDENFRRSFVLRRDGDDVAIEPFDYHASETAGSLG